MILLLLLAQIGLTNADGGTPHSSMLNWPAVIVTATNDDGTTWTRPALGYYVYRAPVVNGVQGDFVLLNADAVVIGMVEDDGTADPIWYEDEAPEQGRTYVYAVSAVDFGGESPKSIVSNSVTVPINPNAPSNMQAVVN